ASAGAGLPGRDLSKLLSAPQQAANDAVRPAALYNYNMFSYLDAKWFAPLIKFVVSHEPMVKHLERIVGLQPDFNNAGAIGSAFDGRYRFSRYFSPLHFNRPTTYEALVANNDLESLRPAGGPGRDAQLGAGRHRQGRADHGAERQAERAHRRGSWR